MQTVFLDYAAVSYEDLDSSSLDAAVRLAGADSAVTYHATTEEPQIIERIRNADIVLLDKVKLARSHLEAARYL